ncbi:MAG: pyruvate, water dikinase regulatory protein [Maricaulaceae bacterium]
MTRNPNTVIYFHIHLVSDSTGETLVAMMKASTAQFGGVTPLEHLHSMVRSEAQLESALKDIEERPGVVLYTLLDPDRRRVLEEHCEALNIPAVSVLDTTLAMLGRYLGAPVMQEIGAQRTMDSEYYNRIAALDFAMSHDDGQNIPGLKNADIILLGVSRTSKTPTSIYLANRGYHTGNIPLVPGMAWPEIIESYKKPFIVGLFASPSRIVQIRKNRVESMGSNESSYTDEQKVREEITATKRKFVKLGYPVVDVTRRSIEETAAQIINLYQIHQDKKNMSPLTHV